MPGRDGTGPLGMRPGSGRGLGPCAGYPTAPYSGCGMGFGRGRGYRRIATATGLPGWIRYGYPAMPAAADPAQEKALLQNQANFLEAQLEQVKNQLKNLE
jgi:hypothetical protein